MYIKTRKAVGWIALCLLFVIIYITLAAERIATQVEVGAPQEAEFFLKNILTTTWFLLTGLAKWSMIQEARPNLTNNLLSLFTFFAVIIFIRTTPDDGTTLIISDPDKIIIAVGVTAQPVTDFWDFIFGGVLRK